jgi:hypothetical protein
MVGKAGLTVGKLGDGTMTNGALTGVQPWWVGEGVGLWGAEASQLNVGGYGAVHRRGGCNPLVAPGCTRLHGCTQCLFYKGDTPWRLLKSLRL